MINDRNTQFTYDPNTHTTICKRRNKSQVFTGVAKCHPNDWDFESKLVGEHYAYTRSMIKELVANREELRAQIKGLKHLYNILEQNPRVHYDSIECYTIRRQIKLMERDVHELKTLIKETKEEMLAMIRDKDIYYNAIRESRKKEAK